jgi:hypothetical protein
MIFDADRCTSQSWMATTHIDCAKDIPEPYVRYAFEAVAGLLQSPRASLTANIRQAGQKAKRPTPSISGIV